MRDVSVRKTLRFDDTYVAKVDVEVTAARRSR